MNRKEKYMKWYRNLACTAVAMGALLVGTSPEARAAFILQLTDGTEVVTIMDGDADDPCSIAGAICFAGEVGSFAANVGLAISKPITGSTTRARLVLIGGAVSTLADSTLQITLTDTDFFLDGQDGNAIALSNAVIGNTEGQVTAQGFIDFNNAEFGMQFSTPPLGPLGPGDFSTTASSLVPSPGDLDPFSLTEIVTITHSTANQISSFGKVLTASVPEPDTLLLLGIGLLGLAGSSWWQRRQHN